MRSWRATHNLVAVSANSKETAINTVQTLDTSMLVDMSTVINLEPRRETNADELTGKEEPDNIYDLGNISGGDLAFPKGQPQHFAFLMAYGLGAISTAAAGTGYEHTITPIDGDEDEDRSLPTFTAGQRFGSTVLKRQFASMAVDNFVATFAKDSWCTISGSIKGTGKVADNITEETITVTPGADPFELSTSLTLAANKVEGATAPIRLQNVQRIRVELSTGVWTDVSYTVVSVAEPAVITIESLNANDINDVDFKVLYIPEEAGWMSFPARVTETPLRVAEIALTVGGKWSGSAFEGGKSMGAELNSIEWNFNNGLEVNFVPGATEAYAARIFRPARSQTLKLNREFRDYIMQQHVDDNDDFGLHILAEGAVFDGAHKYTVEIIFPKLSVLSAPISVSGKVVAEAGDLIPLEDDTYGSVIVNVKNLQSTYAA